MIRKIFSSEKIVEGFYPNLLGLQIFRLIFSFLNIKLTRIFPVYKNSESKLLKNLYKNGYYVKKFLDKEQLNKLKIICDRDLINSKEIRRGATKELICTEEILKGNKSEIFTFLKEINILYFFEYIEGFNISYDELNVSLEKTTFGKVTDKDINREWHVDSFYSQYKFWIPLEEINNQNFPMKYIKNSNLLTLQRIWDEWVWSFNYQNQFNRKSRRAPKSRKFYLDSKSINLKAKAGNLIIADVSGFHRRGEGELGAVRYWLRVDFTRSPFVPKLTFF